MSREVGFKIGKSTKILVLDDKGAGGANHHYVVENADSGCSGEVKLFCKVQFQNGLEPEIGVNGCTIEDLIMICIDRLQCFQAGSFPCRENAIALTKLEEATMWLDKRTQNRIDRGVEGKTVK